MKLQQFFTYQYQDSTLWNNDSTSLKSGTKEAQSLLHTPGIINSTSATYTPSSLTVACVLPAPFGVLFSDGTLSQAHGTTDGADTTSYTVDFSSLVPSSGSITAYCVASYASVQQDSFTIVGPPPGHPDYDPSFTPYQAYNYLVDSLSLTATSGVPNNTTDIELFRVTLSAGQTTIASVDTTHEVFAGAIVSGIANAQLAGPLVYSFNTRTGAVTLSSADITSALGYTPYSSGGGTINGNVVITGTLDLTSDKRVKSSIKPIKNALDKIKNLNPVSYYHELSQSSEYGFIAQEVESVLPKAVTKPKNPEDLYSLKYNSVFTILVKAVQELSLQVDELKKQVGTKD